jgi:hypothetical protein
MTDSSIYNKRKERKYIGKTASERRWMGRIPTGGNAGQAPRTTCIGKETKETSQ